MPNYNGAKYIKETVESVLAQTYTNWELIIVDDCSTDNTDEIIVKYLSDDRIRYLKNEKNSGAAVSRNYALREARGRWVAFLDSDDTWHPEKLERQIAFMEENGYKFTYTDYKIQLNGEWLPYVYTGPKKVTKRKMKDYCYFSTITVMYDREAIGLIQIEPVKKNNDYAMWLRIIEKAPCYRYPECLSSYIKHEGSISSGSKLKLIKHHYILFRKAQEMGPVASFLLTGVNLVFGVLRKAIYKKPISAEK
jgi:glycosyltransferase involved in cell wall biosynthesis